MVTTLYRCCLSLAGVFLLAACDRVGSSASLPTGKGAVTGGIGRCDALGVPGPKYMAGAVTVLRGQIKWHKTSSGNFATILPKHVAGRTHVGMDETNRFVLAPGYYVLTARFPPPSDYRPLIGFKLRAGEAPRVDLPNQCI